MSADGFQVEAVPPNPALWPVRGPCDIVYVLVSDGRELSSPLVLMLSSPAGIRHGTEAYVRRASHKDDKMHNFKAFSLMTEFLKMQSLHFFYGPYFPKALSSPVAYLELVKLQFALIS